MTRLSRNLVFNVVGQGLALLLSFVAVKFIFKQLGDDLFGIIYFNITLATVVSAALELGVLATTSREVALYFGSEPRYVTKLIQTASLLYWSFGILILVGVLVLAPILVENWINLKTTDAHTATTVIRILSVSTMLVLPRSLYTSIFRGRQRMELNNIIDVTTTVTQQIGIVALLKLGEGAFVVAGWISVSVAMGLVAYVVVAVRMFGWPALMPKLHPEVVTRNVRYTSLMMANSLLSLVYTQADKVVVSKLLPVAEFGFYSFASSTVGRAAFVAAAIGQAAFPSFANLSAAGEHEALIRQFRKLQGLVSFVTAPMFAAICFAATPVYSYLFNPAVAGRLLVPTILLAVGFYLNSSLNPPFMLSFAVGKPQIIVRANVVALFVVVPVTVLLIATNGLTGAAASWVFYNLFAYAYIVPKICRDALQITAWSWYRRVLTSGGLALVVYALSWYLIARPASFSLAALSVAYVAASLVFAAGAYFLIDSDLRDTLVRVARSLGFQKAPADDPITRAPASVPPARALTETLIVGSTGVALGLVIGGLASLHSGWGAVGMIASVCVAAVVLIRLLGWTVGPVVLLIASCFVDRNTFPVGRIDVRPEQIAALLGLAVLIASRLRSGGLDWLRPSAAETALGAWFAVGLVSSLIVAPVHSESLKVLALLVLSSVALVLPRRLLEHREELDHVIRWLLLAFALEGGFALAAYLLHLFGSNIALSVNPGTGHLSAYGSLWEPNVLGAICAAGAIAWMYLGHRHFHHSWVGIALCLSGAVVSFARAAWLAVVVLMLLSLIASVRRQIYLRGLAFGTAATLVVIGAVVAIDKLGSYSVSLTGSTGSLTGSVSNGTDVLGRLYQIKPVFAELRASPIVGGGIDSFGQRHITGGVPEHLANLSLAVINDTGLLGVAVFGVFVVIILVAVWRRRHDATVIGLGVMTLLIALTNQATETLELMITWVLIGLLLAAVQVAETVSPSSTAGTARDTDS